MLNKRLTNGEIRSGPKQELAFWVTAKITAITVFQELGLALEDMATMITRVATRLLKITVTHIKAMGCILVQ